MECSGIGLHSGAPVSMRILPAPSGTGIVFRRTDLDGFQIEAMSRNVARVSYATSLMKKGVLISTTEHVLSAFIGIGIDNAIVELDNLELPILDGSAKPFVEMIHKAGIRKQRRAREISEEFAVSSSCARATSSSLFIPSIAYSVSYSINFPHPLIGKETFAVELTNGSYLRHIAAARTFGSREDEQAMRNMGLIRGASRENCIVLTRDGVENGPLRFPDEFVRHKVLDLVGDLALLGKQVLGKVVADRAGHAMHTALVSRILRDKTLWEEVTFPAEDKRSPPPHSDSIGRILPLMLVRRFTRRVRWIQSFPSPGPLLQKPFEFCAGLIDHGCRELSRGFLPFTSTAPSLSYSGEEYPFELLQRSLHLGDAQTHWSAFDFSRSPACHGYGQCKS